MTGVIQDPFALGMEQASRYWRFLFFALDDVKQVIRLVCVTHPPSLNLKAFNLALNRGLYGLARDLGFRKRHITEGRNERLQWWERRSISFEEYKRQI